MKTLFLSLLFIFGLTCSYGQDQLGLGEKEADSIQGGIDFAQESSLPSENDLGISSVDHQDIVEIGPLEEMEAQEVDRQESIVQDTPNTTMQTDINIGEIDQKPKERYIQLQARYLGLLGQAGFDVRVWNQLAMGLYYGRFQGTVAGNDDPGVIPDLHHLNLQTTVFLNSQRKAFHSGAQLRFGVHGNKQKDSELVDLIEVDGREVIRPGQTRFGVLIGAGYGWYGNRFSFNIGAEYLSLGALKTLVPLALSLGVTF